jgi:uncharacterized protein with HEPN domain
MPSDTDSTHRWLVDIRHHIVMAEGFVAGVEYDAFKNDNLRLYAVTRCLEIISKASRRLPVSVKARYPSIPWRKMAAAGNVYRHQYEDVAAQAVWRTLRHDLPLLPSVVQQELSLSSPTPPEQSG